MSTVHERKRKECYRFHFVLFYSQASGICAYPHHARLPVNDVSFLYLLWDGGKIWQYEAGGVTRSAFSR